MPRYECVARHILAHVLRRQELNSLSFTLLSRKRRGSFARDERELAQVLVVGASIVFPLDGRPCEFHTDAFFGVNVDCDATTIRPAAAYGRFLSRQDDLAQLTRRTPLHLHTPPIFQHLHTCRHDSLQDPLSVSMDCFVYASEAPEEVVPLLFHGSRC